MKGLGIVQMILAVLLGVQQCQGAGRLVLSAMRRAPQAMSAAREAASSLRQHMHESATPALRTAVQQYRPQAVAIYKHAKNVLKDKQLSNTLQEMAAQRVLATAIGPTAAGLVAGPLLHKVKKSMKGRLLTTQDQGEGGRSSPSSSGS